MNPKRTALSLNPVQTERTARAACALTFLAVSLSLSGAVSSYEGMTVSSVEFVPARQPLDSPDLSKLLSVQAGQPLHLSDIQRSLDRLYATGEFSDIAADAQPSPGGVTLRFLTSPAYFVRGVAVTGVPDPPNPGQLQTAAKLRLGASYSDRDLPRAVENLQDLLRRNGFYEASIQPRADRDESTRQVDLQFHVDPGKRAKFDGIVLTGQPGRSEANIIRVSGWKRILGRLSWRPFTETRLLSGVASIRRYYQDRDFLLVKVDLTKLEYHSDTGTVTPTIDIQPGPLVRVQIQGVRLSKGKRRQLLPVYQELAVDRDLLVQGQRNLAGYFQAQGYFDAGVTFTDSVLGGARTIAYTVDRGPRHELRQLLIAGNHYFDTATIRERMYITTATAIRYRHGRFSHRDLERDLDTIRQLYRSNGFQDVNVASAETAGGRNQGRSSGISIRIDIVEGPQSFVSSLDLSGVPKGDGQAVRALLQSAQGQPYSEVNIAGDRDRILEYFFDQGYADAAFDYEAKPSGPHRVALLFRVQTGNRELVRGVLVSGLKATHKNIVDHNILLTTGDPLSQTSISESQRRLDDLGIFSSVQSAIQNPEGVEPSKFVLYQVDEAHRYSFNVGVGAQLGRIGSGATTFDAPAGTTGFSPLLSLGVSRINFLGLGHTVGIQSSISTLEQKSLFSYVAPAFEGHQNLNLQFNALFDRSQDIRTFNSQRLEGSVQLGQHVSRALTVQYRFTYRKVNIIGTPLITPGLIPVLAQPVRVGFVSTTLIHDRRDDVLDPHRGIYDTITVDLASGAFGSQTGFVRVQARNATYHRLTKNLVFARSLDFGVISRYSGLASIPLAEELFSGGANTNRAFPENQAGPRDTKTGFPLGGSALLFNSLELRFPLVGDNLSGVVFHDMGNVYSSLSDISLRFRQENLQDFNYGVQAIGVGVRYRTPVGPLRIDLSLSPDSPRFFGFKGTYLDLLNHLGTPVNQRINIFQFHFSLGQTF